VSESGEVVGGWGGGEVGAGEVCVCGGGEVRGAGEGKMELLLLVGGGFGCRYFCAGVASRI